MRTLIIVALMLLSDSAISATLEAQFVKTLSVTEGSKDHKDHLGIVTSAYGMVDDAKRLPGATRRNNNKAVKIYNKHLSSLTTPQKLVVAKAIVKDIITQLTKDISGFNKLDDTMKILVIDAKWNTGVNFKGLTKAGIKYNRHKSNKNLKEVGKQSRRKAGGKYLRGMDNRVAKLFKLLGLIKTTEEAKELGLPLTREP